MLKRLILIIIFLVYGKASASVIVKVMVVNPSKEISRTIPVKIYLPKEARPENIINNGGFEIVYDASAGQFMGVQNVTLSPGESVTKMIEIDDVWKIKKEEVTKLRDSINKTVDRLKDSPAFKEAKDLQTEVVKIIQEVEEIQKKSFSNPEEQIAAFRESQKKLEEARLQLEKVANLIVQESTPDVVNVGHISVKTTWRIIIGIIILLSVLSIAFFVIWQNQLSKMPKDETNK